MSEAKSDESDLSALLYVVFKEAVCRHECGGVFTTLEKAEQAAEILRDGERDDHHNYVIVPFRLDHVTEQVPLTEHKMPDGSKYFSGGELLEMEQVLDVGCKDV